MDSWSLPTTAVICGREYKINTDFRDILDILRHLDDPDLPEFLRWQIALALFYDEGVEGMTTAEQQSAMQYLADFIRCGQPEDQQASRKLLDWDQDAQPIIADINKVAGTEIRALPYLHWWSFMAFFNGIGEGQLSTIISIRDKIGRGKKLEKWERDFYQKNKSRVDLRKKYSTEDLEKKEKLMEELGIS